MTHKIESLFLCVENKYERSDEVEICVIFTRFALKILFGSNVRSDYERSDEVEICVVFTCFALKICLAQMLEVIMNA